MDDDSRWGEGTVERWKTNHEEGATKDDPWCRENPDGRPHSEQGVPGECTGNEDRTNDVQVGLLERVRSREQTQLERCLESARHMEEVKGDLQPIEVDRER